MEEQKFKEILEEAGVPANCMNAWLKQHKEDAGPLGLVNLNYSPQTLLFFAKNAVAKGCRAPW